MRGSIEIPELETGQFIDDDGLWREFVKNINGWSTDVADEVGVFVVGIQKRFNKRADGAFTLGGSDTNDGAGAVLEEIFSD